MKDTYDHLLTEYSETGSGLLMMWFTHLTQCFKPNEDISAHVNGFQEAFHHLAHADFPIPEAVAAAILLSTLPSNPEDPKNWIGFIGRIQVTKTTKLTSVINSILE